MKARELLIDKITTFSQTQPVYTKEKLANNILLALKEVVLKIEEVIPKKEWEKMTLEQQAYVKGVNSGIRRVAGLFEEGKNA